MRAGACLLLLAVLLRVVPPAQLDGLPDKAVKRWRRFSTYTEHVAEAIDFARRLETHALLLSSCAQLVGRHSSTR